MKTPVLEAYSDNFHNNLSEKLRLIWQKVDSLALSP